MIKNLYFLLKPYSNNNLILTDGDVSIMNLYSRHGSLQIPETAVFFCLSAGFVEKYFNAR